MTSRRPDRGGATDGDGGSRGVPSVRRRAPLGLWWIFARGSGGPCVADIAGFLPGRDILCLDVDPAAFPGPVILRVRRSADGRHGIVALNDETVAVLREAPDAHVKDIRLDLRGRLFSQDQGCGRRS